MPLIATTQRRPHAPIDMGPWNTETQSGARRYFFLPSDPADPGSIHVATVSEDDYDALIKLDGYFRFKGEIPAAVSKPAPQAPATPAAPPATVPAPPATETTPVVTDPAASATGSTETATDTTTAGGNPESDLADPEIEAAALALLGLSWQRVGAELGKGGIPNAVAERALAIELAKHEDDQKMTIVNKLRAALGKTGA